MRSRKSALPDPAALTLASQLAGVGVPDTTTTDAVARLAQAWQLRRPTLVKEIIPGCLTRSSWLSADRSPRRGDYPLSEHMNK